MIRIKSPVTIQPNINKQKFNKQIKANPGDTVRFSGNSNVKIFDKELKKHVQVALEKSFENNATVYKLKSGDNLLGTVSLIHLKPNFLRKEAKTFISGMNTSFTFREKYQNIGKKLHQIAIEQSLINGCCGRVTLNASLESHGFHYKCGYKFDNPTANTEIEQQLAQNPKKAILNYNTSMYLPEETLKKHWIPEILSNPVFGESLEKI